MKKYRLYIDESGTQGYSKQRRMWDKYLGLIGVIISQDEYERVLQPRLKKIKRLFNNDLDNLPILHRDEITKKQGDFKRLEDKEFEAIYNTELLSLFAELEFKICCIVINKEEHQNNYITPAHPYHYCLAILLERYTGFLKEIKGVGDVLAESRGGKEDIELKSQYIKFYEKGTQYRQPDEIQKLLTSKEIKMKKKSERIDGLELADLLAVPTKIDVLSSYNQGTPKDNFNKKIIETIQDKYFKNQSGKVKGYGKKML